MNNVSLIDGHIDEPAKLTDEQIIKNFADIVEFYKKLNLRSVGTFNDILDLITRLKAENEKLTKIVDNLGDYFPACIDCEGKSDGERTDKCVYLEDTANYCIKRGITNIANIQKENRQLKAEIERWKEQNVRLNKECDHFIRFARMPKSEARKEFAERLKNKMFCEDYLFCEPCDMADMIDNLLEEMEGE